MLVAHMALLPTDASSALSYALSVFSSWRSGDDSKPASSEDYAHGGNRNQRASHLHSIPLLKQDVPIYREGKQVASKTAYFGHIKVGSQHDDFTVVFDTGSGHLILPSIRCDTPTCRIHHRFNHSASSSAQDVTHHGKLKTNSSKRHDEVTIAFGTGQVRGDFVQDDVCLGDGLSTTHCANLRIVVAKDMSPDPFGLFGFDGVMGLGLSKLALNRNFNLLGMMSEQNREFLPQFSVFLDHQDNDNSHISFGGHDPAKALDLMAWVPVALEELGYWQVHLKGVYIGDQALEECEDGTCRAILDTGSSMIGVPRMALRSMHKKLAHPVPDSHMKSDPTEINCREVPGPDLIFDLGNFTVSLRPENLARPQPWNVSDQSGNSRLFCRSLLLPLDIKEPLGPKVFIFGEPMLKRYYTAYDFAKTQVGFAMARQPPGKQQPTEV